MLSTAVLPVMPSEEYSNDACGIHRHVDTPMRTRRLKVITTIDLLDRRSAHSHPLHHTPPTCSDLAAAGHVGAWVGERAEHPRALRVRPLLVGRLRRRRWTLSCRRDTRRPRAVALSLIGSAGVRASWREPARLVSIPLN